MRAYIIRRLLLMIPTLLLVTIIVFLSVRLIPGDVIDIMVAEMSQGLWGIGELTKESLLHSLGLDVPTHIQYVRWLGDVLQGNLGDSLWQHRPVTEMIFERIPVTFELASLAILFALLIAFPIGIYSAIRQDSWGDYISRTIAILCISVPYFWLGTIVIVYPSIWWSWVPSLSYISPIEDLPGNLLQFVVPGLVAGMSLSGITMRMTRTMMLEVLRQDYIRTAWAKGLTERTIIFRHALKNALIPVVSQIGLEIPIVFAGTVVLEQIFCLPGVGLLLLQALNRRDYPVISGVSLMVVGLVFAVNLLVDLSYTWLDPRVQYK